MRGKLHGSSRDETSQKALAVWFLPLQQSRPFWQAPASASRHHQADNISMNDISWKEHTIDSVSKARTGAVHIQADSLEVLGLRVHESLPSGCLCATGTVYLGPTPDGRLTEIRMRYCTRGTYSVSPAAHTTSA